MYLYHLPNVEPSDIGLVWFAVECLHNPELSRKAFDYQHRNITDWLYAHFDLKHKEQTIFTTTEDAIIVRNGKRRGYKIKSETRIVREQNEDE